MQPRVFLGFQYIVLCGYADYVHISVCRIIRHGDLANRVCGWNTQFAAKNKEGKLGRGLRNQGVVVEEHRRFSYRSSFSSSPGRHLLAYGFVNRWMLSPVVDFFVNGRSRRPCRDVVGRCGVHLLLIGRPTAITG